MVWSTWLLFLAATTTSASPVHVFFANARRDPGCALVTCSSPAMKMAPVERRQIAQQTIGFAAGLELPLVASLVSVLQMLFAAILPSHPPSNATLVAPKRPRRLAPMRPIALAVRAFRRSALQARRLFASVETSRDATVLAQASCSSMTVMTTRNDVEVVRVLISHATQARFDAPEKRSWSARLMV